VQHCSEWRVSAPNVQRSSQSFCHSFWPVTRRQGTLSDRGVWLQRVGARRRCRRLPLRESRRVSVSRRRACRARPVALIPMLAASPAPRMRRVGAAAGRARSARPIRCARIAYASPHLIARPAARAGVARGTNVWRFRARPTLRAAAAAVYASPVPPGRSVMAEPAVRQSRSVPLAADTRAISPLPTGAAARTAAITARRARPAENARSACASILRAPASDARRQPRPPGHTRTPLCGVVESDMRCLLDPDRGRLGDGACRRVRVGCRDGLSRHGCRAPGARVACVA
jgi:hypothetical protein